MESGTKYSSTKKKTSTKKTSTKKKTLDDKDFFKDRITKKIKTNSVIKKGCLDKNNVLDKKFKVQTRIGTDSVDGEVYKGCYSAKCKYKIAIKKIPMTYEIKYVNDPENESVLNHFEVYSELFFLKLSSFLVHNDVVPNLPLIYDTYSCEDDCKFINPELKGKKKCMLVINELADGDLKYIIKKVKPNIDIIKIMYFQIYVSLYCMRKYFNLYHNDLHYGNVLFRKIKPGGYIKYIIEGIDIVVPNIGYIMILWDFGRSFIPGKIEPHKTKNKDIEFMDFLRITAMLSHSTGKYAKEYDIMAERIENLIHRLKNYNDFMIVYSMLVHTDNVKEEDIIAVYDTDKKIKSKNSNINKYLVSNPKKSNPEFVKYFKNEFNKLKN
jgi:hypothetical protein